MAPKTKPAPVAPVPRRPKAAPAVQPPEKTHKQRFEQLLDDVVLGVPPKR